MLASLPLRRTLFVTGLSVLLALGVSCSSNNNNSSGNKPANSGAAVTQAPAASAAAAATKAPAASAAAAASAAPAASAAANTSGSPAAGGVQTVAKTFNPPGGSADWLSGASGCHGVKAPAGAEAPKASDTGITPTEIHLGTTQPLSGAAVGYIPIIKTMQACFNQVNAEGGIYGRKINITVYDDQYIPANTVPLVHKLVEQDKVFAIASLLGTPTNTSVFDYLNDQKVPQIWILSGAPAWGADPKSHPYAIGWQPDYVSEGNAYATYIQQNLKGKKIGILYQNDDYGKGYLQGITKVIGDKGTADNPIVDEEVYETTASDVSGQVTNLKDKGAEVFILIAIPKFAGLALKAAADQGWKPAIILNSVALDPSLNGLAGGPQNVTGAISDLYYHQFNENDPAVTEVKDFLTKNAPDVQMANFPIFGYMIGQTYVETLKRAGVNPTRDSLMQAAESFQKWTIPQLLPGITFSTSFDNRRPLSCFKLAKANPEGSFDLFGDTICAHQ
ncbi:MAG TPA: ABC transporter substrate-binding protein [Dehalococcoidia bacterium]|nr:ABC transporter substrate-binding protein [Dehalococcoidia bacterium]